MPIETVQHAVHIRRKQNALVFRNIARLWDIARHSQSEQQLLDQLHPWQANPRLKFDNGLAIFLLLSAVLLLLPWMLLSTSIWTQITALLSVVLLFWSYLIYEPKKPIRDVIEYLEQEMITKKYDLHYHRPPHFLTQPLNPRLFIAQLKQKFPLFDQGSLSNSIPFYASSVWKHADQQHQVLIFQYHFVNELQVRDQDGDRVTVKEVHHDLWGVFIFELPPNLGTFAATTHKRKTFVKPYQRAWQSSDIGLNQRVRLSGNDDMALAKTFGPAFSLKLADFFAQRQGDLLLNREHNMLCFLGPDDLMQVMSQQQKKIEDISSLRGHLRTFKLPHLEQLQQDLIRLLG